MANGAVMPPLSGAGGGPGGSADTSSIAMAPRSGCSSAKRLRPAASASTNDGVSESTMLAISGAVSAGFSGATMTPAAAQARYASIISSRPPLNRTTRPPGGTRCARALARFATSSRSSRQVTARQGSRRATASPDRVALRRRMSANHMSAFFQYGGDRLDRRQRREFGVGEASGESLLTAERDADHLAGVDPGSDQIVTVTDEVQQRWIVQVLPDQYASLVHLRLPTAGADGTGP